MDRIAPLEVNSLILLLLELFLLLRHIHKLRVDYKMQSEFARCLRALNATQHAKLFSACSITPNSISFTSLE